MLIKKQTDNINHRVKLILRFVEWVYESHRSKETFVVKLCELLGNIDGGKK